MATSRSDPGPWLYCHLLGREPGKTASHRIAEFLKGYEKDPQSGLAALAHVLLASTEFLFIE